MLKLYKLYIKNYNLLSKNKALKANIALIINNANLVGKIAAKYNI